MKWRNVLILVTPAYQPRLAGIARYARQHNWQLTILDRIAYRTGFCNPAYFTNTFRRVTGLAPKNWRKSLA